MTSSMNKIINISDFIEAKKPKIDRRFEFFCDSLKQFVLMQKDFFNRDIKLISDDINSSAVSLNTAYWLRFQQIFYPYVQNGNGDKTNIRHEKIISAVELTIVEQQPLFVDANKSIENFRINGVYAFFVATALMCEWEKFDVVKYNNTLSTDKKLQEINTDHKTWLTNLDPLYDYPVFLNAQYWNVYIELIKKTI